MASVVNRGMLKQPLKVIEIPLNKFSEEVIPHHQTIFQEYKLHIHKLIQLNNADELSRETKHKKRTIKQLKDLMYELDTLRTQVEDSDLDRFDMKTLSLRKIILGLIQGYGELEKSANAVIAVKKQAEDELEKENVNPFEGASQIQIEDDMNDLKLKQHVETLNRVENINKDVEDLHEMYRDLHDMVGDQAEHVENVEQNVTAVQENVDRGFKELIKAHKLKTMAYPMTGAFVGSLIGGPVGLVAGLKVGGLAAIGCALAGLAGGKFLYKVHEEAVENNCDAVVNNQNNENKTQDEKKDI